MKAQSQMDSVVFVIDDDASIRTSLTRLLESGPDRKQCRNSGQIGAKAYADSH